MTAKRQQTAPLKNDWQIIKQVMEDLEVYKPIEVEVQSIFNSQRYLTKKEYKGDKLFHSKTVGKNKLSILRIK